MPSVSPVVYNYADLFSWQAELTPIQLQISEYSQFIKEKRQNLVPLHKQLSALNSSISLIEQQMDMNLGMPSNIIYPRIDYYGSSIQVLNSYKLQFRLDSLLKERDALKRRMGPYEREISEAQASLYELNSRRAWLNEHIPAAQLFLQTLQENPLASVQALSNKIWDTLIHYEDTHLTGLSPQVRIGLLAVRNLNQLTSYPEGYIPDYTNQIHRANYLRLCGFLWDIYLKVQQEKKDAEFERILGSLIESTHVAQYGDLPYPMQTNYNASAWFASNVQTMPGYFAIQEQYLPIVEEQILNNGFAFIAQNKPDRPTSLQKHIINAVNLIDAEVKMKKQKNEEIDYHFYARAVFILNDVLVNPTDKQAAKRLGEIAEYASGNSSVGKQVLGGLLIVFGALLISASVVGFITTFGSSSVLSAWGFALGLSLFETEFVFGIASSLAAAAGISLTFFAGPRAMESGGRKGLSQELMDIKEGIENYDEPPPYSVTVLN
ncbi:hypothetical protein [Legionella parisiensis]|uniref:Uncharacterized protein n=1 Tax=Legionella parisiensis TaxID=45071 RepID=A0A1E5JWA7_9GAMM|nr:hypothetical protein [Legionella parisiensis]KTD40016.1 hypothetical protein Lpar_1333 [Legionella parisiensis]OEH48770.1 hypothetical protein lpari_00170 [Legionella parisiensis]STX77440.1 Uncharacterised protein [Legionella parisiensis]